MVGDMYPFWLKGWNPGRTDGLSLAMNTGYYTLRY